ncbi:MAG: SufD family Fe-S cluster assembly protein [Candidatus Bathyarchaeia archaeon]
MVEKSELTRIPHQILAEATRVGLNPSEEDRSGTFLHIDQNTIYSKINEVFEGKLELMDMKKALMEYPWLKDMQWKLIDEYKDEYTKKVAERFSGGYFMRILPHAEVTFPIQSCLMITEEGLEQRIHNVVLAEEGSKAHLITGCLQHSNVNSASHIGVTEIYVKKEATLNFTMIHDWGKETLVRPRTSALIEEKGSFISNYLCLKPVKDVQMYPTAICEGEKSRVSFNTILYGHEDSHMDIGSRAVLNGEESRAELITRAVAGNSCEITVRGMIEGNSVGSKGHLECRGLILDEKSLIHSIPELIARKKGVEITHEAAIGKISETEIIYLMTRKMTRDQAVSTIIRGFMDVSIMGLPKHLEDEISRIVDLAAGPG